MNINSQDFENTGRFLTIDGIDYEIPKRTSEIQSKLEAHDKKQWEEYEGYLDIVNIIFGKENTKKIFNKGKHESLDMMNKVCVYALALYYADKKLLEEEKINEVMEQITPLSEKINSMANSVDLVSRKK